MIADQSQGSCHIFTPKCWYENTRANSVDSDQTAPKEQSDQSILFAKFVYPHGRSDTYKFED